MLVIIPSHPIPSHPIPSHIGATLEIIFFIVDDTCLPGESAFPTGDTEGIMVTVQLGCSVSAEVPQPVPPPTLTWFRSGVEVARAAVSGTMFELNMDFLMEFPILITGVFSVGGTVSPTFQVLQSGLLIFNTLFDNISDPMLGNLPMDITLRQARAMLFDILLANWTCAANNTLGTSSVQHNIRMCGKLNVS